MFSEPRSELTVRQAGQPLGVRFATPGNEAQGVWWSARVREPIREAPQRIFLDLDSVVIDTLRFSAHVRAVGDQALIAETAIASAAAEFDSKAFMESKFVRTSVPTGSTLDAGFNVPRLREEDWHYSAGMRRKNRLGGRVEASQQLGTRDSNSNFFVPENQGNARFTLSYNQPLLNGAGRAYNESLILLAELDTGIASNQASLELQGHLVQVTELFWELYLQRVHLLQQQRHLERASVILDRLQNRRHLDSLGSQISRARAAVAARRVALISSGARIRDAEARLRALVNSPGLLSERTAELIPQATPTHDYFPVDLADAVLTALQNRPEIDISAREIEAARIRVGLACHELMPMLDVVLETYVSGLRGDYRVGQSWRDQFSVGEPSYTMGLLFEVPVYQRAAKSKYQRRQLELRRLMSQFDAAVELLHADVEVATRAVETAYAERGAKREAMLAAESDVSYLERRWKSLPGADRSASFVLEDLLDSQDRLLVAEYELAEAGVNYTLSLTLLRRAMGTLLQCERIEVGRGCLDGLPIQVYSQAAQRSEVLPPLVTVEPLPEPSDDSQ